jgi:hypothetical protein
MQPPLGARWLSPGRRVPPRDVVGRPMPRWPPSRVSRSRHLTLPAARHLVEGIWHVLPVSALCACAPTDRTAAQLGPKEALSCPRRDWSWQPLGATFGHRSELLRRTAGSTGSSSTSCGRRRKSTVAHLRRERDSQFNAGAALARHRVRAAATDARLTPNSGRERSNRKAGPCPRGAAQQGRPK